MGGLLSEYVSEANFEFAVVEATTPQMVEQAYRLRHQVYCIEREFEAAAGGLETDEYDRHSRHVLLIHRDSDQVLGTGRLILCDPAAPHDSFPMQRVCDPGLLTGLPVAVTAEISRFAISKLRRTSSTSASLIRTVAMLMRLGLVRGLLELSRDAGVTHWCAVMEPSLLRLLRATAIHFEHIGPLVEYHGTRQPALTSLDALFGRMFPEAFEVWEYVTAGGRLMPPPAWQGHERQLAA